MASFALFGDSYITRLKNFCHFDLEVFIALSLSLSLSLSDRPSMI